LQKIEAANKQSLHKILQGEPVLIDVQPAADVVEGIGEGLIPHAGPPITYDRMCGPMREAICGVAVSEGWADDLKERRRRQLQTAALHFTRIIISRALPLRCGLERSMPGLRAR
jgi:hypothetical protein